ncbi:exodeoxyribonuclease V subunit alpha [Perlucidibaca piscinae]|uniref:exodeoxyribonuclease V subunit alpha n=1 Tax=Perlucidibaca piscinae TaxID=392589 RepID=UPI0003B4D94D|nr:exodeoxyribonuclease V subunit alpha [Perlucidibaca piscinae]
MSDVRQQDLFPAPALALDDDLPMPLPPWPALAAGLLQTGELRPLDVALVDSLCRHARGVSVLACLLTALTSRQLGQGHVRLALEQLLQEPHRQLMHAGALAVLDDARRRRGGGSWSDLLQDCAWLTASPRRDTSAPLVLQDSHLYLRRSWQDETAVAAALRQRLQPVLPLPASAALAAWLDELFPRKSQPADAATPAPDWQKLACALAVRQRFTVITGGPGTGKTTTVLKLLALLQRQALAAGGEPLRIRLAAPTGKAAARLNETLTGAVAALPVADAIKAVIPVDVATVHRLLGAQGESRRFRHHAGNRLALDVLVIDEASMLDLAMMAAVLAALPESARLILLGDKDQLASVEAGAVMGDLCAGAVDGRYDPALASWLGEVSGEDVSPWQRSPGASVEALDQHVIMLRHSYRFAADRGIGRLAAAMQAGAAASPGQLQAAAPEVGECLPDQLAQPYDVYRRCLAERPDSGDEAAQAAWLERLFSAFERYRILAPFRQGADGVAALNEALDRRWGGEHAGSWYAGRPVMVTRNDARLGLMNGDVGLTLWSLPRDGEEPRLRVVFRDAARHGCWRWLLPARLPAVETVYAMTVHKSQGSEFEQVTLVLPAIGHERLTRELVYTALTRARRRFDLCPANEAVWLTAQAQVTERASGLAQSLRDVTQDTRS